LERWGYGIVAFGAIVAPGSIPCICVVGVDGFVVVVVVVDGALVDDEHAPRARIRTTSTEQRLVARRIKVSRFRVGLGQ